jgi:tRNA G18 (ribose-2'-O)-methylase SpoU
MTQLYLHPFRPEMGDARPLRKLARNYKAVYRQIQSALELQALSAQGRWVAIESRMPGSQSVHDVDWSEIMNEKWAKEQGLHLVTGSMNHGLQPEILETMDYHIYVPQFDDVPFLAPATAAAIVLDRIFVATANRQGVWG